MLILRLKSEACQTPFHMAVCHGLIVGILWIFGMLVSLIFCCVAIPFDPACWSQSVRSILGLDIAKHNPVTLAVAVTNKKGAVGIRVRSGYVNIISDSCRLLYSRRKCLIVEAAESSPQLISPFPNEASLLDPTSHEYELTKSPLPS